MKLKSDRVEFKVQEFSADTKLTRLVLTAGNNFPHPAGSDSVYVLYRDQICPMTWSNGRLHLAASQSEALSQFLAAIQWYDLSPYSMRYSNVPQRNSQAVATPPFETLLRPLIAWSLHLRRQGDIPKFLLPDDRVRLFVWAEQPEPLKIEGAWRGSQQGRVLYVVDVTKAVKP